MGGVVDRGTGDARQVESAVGVEVPVLDRDGGVLQHRGDSLKRHHRTVLAVPRLEQGGAVAGEYPRDLGQRGGA